MNTLSMLDDALRSDSSSAVTSPIVAPHSSPVVEVALGSMSPPPMLLGEYEPVPFLEDGYHVVGVTGETSD